MIDSLVMSLVPDTSNAVILVHQVSLSIASKLISACSENCAQQICPTCATPAQKDAVVDFYEYKSLADIMTTEPETRLITLPCKHIFTIDSLDGSVGMSNWYDQDQTGEWVGIKEPKRGFVKRPMCPTCRGPVTARRYNRITKRALIDIQEQHSIEDISLQIASLRQAVSAVNAENLVIAADRQVTKLSVGKKVTMADSRLGSAFYTHPSEIHCFDPTMFFESVGEWFGLSPNIAGAWRRAVEHPFKVYHKLARMVNNERLPHVQAYESAISKIYHEEMDLAASSRIARDPSAAALLSAKRRVGAPFPQGEARFKIEALLDSIKLRLKLVPTAKRFSLFFRPTISVSAFGVMSKPQRVEVINKDNVANHFARLTWAILSSCRRDVLVALNLCDTAETRRLELTAVVLSLQVDFDFERFGAESYLGRAGGPTQADRADIAQTCNRNVKSMRAKLLVVTIESSRSWTRMSKP